MNQQINAAIIGGAGYTGGELIRILVNHPFVNLSFVHSRSNAGTAVSRVHRDILSSPSLQFVDQLSFLTDGSIDILFLCLGHGESKKFLTENPVSSTVKIIDLANDFRLTQDAVQTHTLPDGSLIKRDFVYGLPELQKEVVQKANYIANPGCFATAIQLGLLPLAKAGLLKDIHTTGITGSTGAGQSLTQTSHFSWRANNIQAYKTLSHQHLSEIGESLTSLQPDGTIDLQFVPWRGDFTRGIFISSTISLDESLEELNLLYTNFYQAHPFTHLSEEPIFLKQIVNTNNALIQLEKVGTKLVIHSAIDNLLKGASGQAVQNMNLLFGLEERTGLHLKAVAF